jgi:hypothetical protein
MTAKYKSAKYFLSYASEVQKCQILSFTCQRSKKVPNTFFHMPAKYKSAKYFLSRASEVQNTKLYNFENNENTLFHLSTGGINVSFGLPDNKQGQGEYISLKQAVHKTQCFEARMEKYSVQTVRACIHYLFLFDRSFVSTLMIHN